MSNFSLDYCIFLAVAYGLSSAAIEKNVKDTFCMKY